MFSSKGFSGFRIDAAKHMGPKNIAQILARLKTKMGGSLPSDFITWLEIIIGGEKDLLACQYKYVFQPLIPLHPLPSWL
jgi:alpha-amylase